MHRFLSADKAVAIIEKELGQPIEKMFKAFDRRPIAAASLGQVWGMCGAGVVKFWAGVRPMKVTFTLLGLPLHGHMTKNFPS